MSRDADLIVTCRCGRIEIGVRGGYETENLKDVALLGGAASTLCKHRRYRRVLWRWLLVACLAGVGVTAWVDGLNRARTEEAGRLCREGEKALDVEKDDLKAVELFTQSIAILPSPMVYNFRGFAHYRMGDYEKAVEDCDAALRLEPGNETARENRRMAMERLKY